MAPALKYPPRRDPPVPTQASLPQCDATPSATPVFEIVRIGDRILHLRAICEDDREREQSFLHHLSTVSAYRRFLAPVHELPPDLLERFVHVDGCRSAALVALDPSLPGEFIAEARYAPDEQSGTCEFGIAVADSWQHHGLGRLLMQRLLERARATGYCRMVGYILTSNIPMLRLARQLGFTVRPDRESPGQSVALIELSRAPAP